MDALLQLLLPDLKPLAQLEREQRAFTWGGTEYPQEPVIYRRGPHIRLITSQIQHSLLSYLPKGYVTEQWVVLDVDHETLDLLEADVNGAEVDWSDNPFDELIQTLLSQCDQWVLIFEPGYDQIDDVYRLSSEQCVVTLKSNLRRDGPRKGFVALPNSER